jgi:hypothetical protein
MRRRKQETEEPEKTAKMKLGTTEPQRSGFSGRGVSGQPKLKLRGPEKVRRAASRHLL